jgi:hypothetical protein
MRKPVQAKSRCYGATKPPAEYASVGSEASTAVWSNSSVGLDPKILTNRETCFS